MIDPPSSSTITVVLGSPFTLSCTSRGSPPDTFTLIKDGIPVTTPPSVTPVSHTDTSSIFRLDYTIHNVTTSDSGTYTCTMANLIGSDSETITVNVAGKFLVYAQLCVEFFLWKRTMYNIALH